MRGSEFAALSAFVAVAERANFAKAASYLGVAPSTLSYTIRTLEERLGVRLLNRTTRNVSLTDAGDRLLARIRPALDELGRAAELVNDFRDTLTGTLRLSVSSIPARMIVAPILRDFATAFPAITLDITIDDRASDIVQGRYDAGIRYGTRIERDMVAVPVSPESRLIAIAAPSYLATRPMPQTPNDLYAHNCIRYRLPNEQILPWEFVHRGEKSVIVVNGTLIVNHVDLLLEATLSGLGIGYMVESYVTPHLEQGLLVRVLDDWSSASPGYYIYYTSRRHILLPLKVFIDFLRRRAG